MRRSTLPALLAICCALGLVLSAGVIVAQTPPGAPTVDTATPGTSSISIVWTAPSDIGSAAIVAYDLRYIRSDASDPRPTATGLREQDIWSSGSLDIQDQQGCGETPRSTSRSAPSIQALRTPTDPGQSPTKEASTTDHGGSRSAATTLSLGSSLEGSIDPVDDEDYFKIVLSSRTDLWVYTSGELDTTGELLNSGGSVVYRNYDGRLVDHPLGFSLRYRLNGGTYYAKVTSHGEESTGTYTIHTERVSDHGGTFTGAKTINLDSKAAGRISPIVEYRTGVDSNGDPIFYSLVEIEMFKFELGSDTEVWVVASASFDSLATLYDSTETVIEVYDDSGWTHNPDTFMFRRSLTAGTYYLKVRGNDGTDFGPYVLYT